MGRKKRILCAFTGGTIASREEAGVFAVAETPYRLLGAISKDRYHVDTFEPICVLSENMTPELLYRLFSELTAKLDNVLYDGILIAHGTDTLAYTAHLADYILSGCSVPVVLFGAKKPLDDPDSDGFPNFLSAVALIDDVQSGVYVTSRGSDGKDYVHAADRVTQADHQDDDFHSFGGRYFGVMEDGGLVKNPAYRPIAKSSSAKNKVLAALPFRGEAPDESVLVLDAVVGTNFKALNIAHPAFRYILQRTYHSGTACAQPEDSPYSLLYLNRLCKEGFKRLFLAPIDRSRTLYESTQTLLDAGITPLFDMPVEAAWAGLILSVWLDIDPDEVFAADPEE